MIWGRRNHLSPAQQRLLRLIRIYEKDPWIPAAVAHSLFNAWLTVGSSTAMRARVLELSGVLPEHDIPEAMWLAQAYKRLKTNPPPEDPKVLAAFLVSGKPAKDRWDVITFKPLFYAVRTRHTEILDWIRATRPDLNTLTIPQALDRSRRWHQEIARKAKAEAARALSPRDTGEVLDLGSGWTAVRLLTPRALDAETAALGHCVGAGGYDVAVQQPDKQFWSIRNSAGTPVLTVHVRHTQQEWYIDQAKGANNRPVGITWENVRKCGTTAQRVQAETRADPTLLRWDELRAYAAFITQREIEWCSPRPFDSVTDDVLYWALRDQGALP